MRRLIGCLAAALFLTVPAFGHMIRVEGITNTFSVQTGEIAADLFEPSWRAEEGLGLVPGQRIPKDPLIQNTSTREATVLVAARVRFFWAGGTPLTGEEMEALSKMVLVDYASDQSAPSLWRRYPGESAALPVQHFYYAAPLERHFAEGEGAGEETAPLFTGVSIPSWVRGGAFALLQQKGGFDIEICSSALPYPGGDAAEQALALAGDGEFPFSGDP